MTIANWNLGYLEAFPRGIHITCEIWNTTDCLNILVYLFSPFYINILRAQPKLNQNSEAGGPVLCIHHGFGVLRSFPGARAQIRAVQPNSCILHLPLPRTGTPPSPPAHPAPSRTALASAVFGWHTSTAQPQVGALEMLLLLASAVGPTQMASVGPMVLWGLIP